MPGIESYGASPRGYPFRRAGYSGGPSNAGFQKSATGWMELDAEARRWRSPMGTPSSGGSALLEAEARVLGVGPLPRGAQLNRMMQDLVPRAPTVPWDLPGNMQGKGYIPRALRGALLPLNAALLALDVWSAWSQFSSWWKHPNSGEIHPEWYGWQVTCDTGLQGVYLMAGGYPCGFGIYVPQDTPTPAAPDATTNTATVIDPANTMGFPAGAYYIAARSNWYRDLPAEDLRPVTVVGSLANLWNAMADPALDYGPSARNARVQRSVQQQMRRAGYAAPLGYAMTDPLAGIKVGTQAWFRQFPEYAAKTYTWTIARTITGTVRDGPPRVTKPVTTAWSSRPQPPRFREKEKKGKYRLGRMIFAEVVTEGCDAARALFQALPDFRQREALAPDKPSNAADARRRYSGRRLKGSDGQKTKAKHVQAYDKFGRPTWEPQKRSCWKMAQAVANHFDEIDVGQAIQNLAKNELEDKIIGKLSGAAAKSLGSAKGNLGHETIGVPTAGPAI